MVPLTSITISPTVHPNFSGSETVYGGLHEQGVRGRKGGEKRIGIWKSGTGVWAFEFMTSTYLNFYQIILERSETLHLNVGYVKIPLP